MLRGEAFNQGDPPWLNDGDIIRLVDGDGNTVLGFVVYFECRHLESISPRLSAAQPLVRLSTGKFCSPVGRHTTFFILWPFLPLLLTSPAWARRSGAHAQPTTNFLFRLSSTEYPCHPHRRLW